MDADGNVTAYARNLLDRVTQVTDALSHQSTYTYYGDGGLAQYATDADGRQTIYSYDADNRVTGINWYSDNGTTLVGTVVYAYDPVGNLTLASLREITTQLGSTFT